MSNMFFKLKTVLQKYKNKLLYSYNMHIGDCAKVLDEIHLPDVIIMRTCKGYVILYSSDETLIGDTFSTEPDLEVEPIRLQLVEV